MPFASATIRVHYGGLHSIALVSTKSFVLFTYGLVALVIVRCLIL